MRNQTSMKTFCNNALWITGMFIACLIVIVSYGVVSSNNDEMTVTSMEGNAVFFQEHEQNDSIDSWETIIQMSEDSEDFKPFTGATCACNVINQNSYDVKDWSLRLDIVQECYLSGFWCGGFEIHQFRDGQEIVNTIANQSEDISGMNLDLNPYSAALMIRLLPGDYLIYLPSAENSEEIIRANNYIGIGFIFYYNDRMDLTHWNLTYHNDIKLKDKLLFKISMVLVGIWLIALIIFHVLVIMLKRVREQLERRIKNISIMAELYLEAYIIQIDYDTARLIKGNPDHLVYNLTGKNVQKSLNEIVKRSCQENYRDDLQRFLNLSDVLERMGDSASIAFEYCDEANGWLAIRIFKAEEDKNKNQIVLALQDINDEKAKLGQIEERMRMAEYKQNVSGSFLETVSFALNDISKKVGNDGKAILKGSNQPEISELANRVVMNTRHMNLIQNTMIDLYAIEYKRLKLSVEPYNIYEMVDEICNILAPFHEGKPYEFVVDVDQSLPPVLSGDRDRIEQILVIILFSSLMMTEKGYVKFSLFGQRHEQEEQLIFSVKDTAKGFSEQQLSEIHEFINGSGIETFDNASLVYLKIINGILTYMGSELKIVSVLNEGSDFYFTLKQDIIE